MSTLANVLNGLSGICIAVVLAGCSGGYSPVQGPESGLTALSISRLAGMTMPHYVDRPVYPDHGQSWISKKTSDGEKTFFVSDWTTNDVFVYKYPQATLVAKLTGFDEPYGQCADAYGNIWIANFEGSSIVEYAHAPTTPIATLSTNGTAIGCAVSPSGNLAVANFSTQSGAGDIQVFANESGTPTDYTNSACYNLWPPGYDKKGNLYVEASTTSGSLVCELAATGTKLVPVKFNQQIVSPGSTMWDGEYITLTDQDYGSLQSTALYRATESKSGNLKLASTTTLTDTCDSSDADVPQPFIANGHNTPSAKEQGFVVLGGNLDCTSRFNYWAYPTPNGDPLLSISGAPKEPYGQGYSTTNKVKTKT
jgi:hypothetical protein